MQFKKKFSSFLPPCFFGLSGVILLLSQSANALEIYRTGNFADAIRRTSQTICLAGGGDDDAWSAGWKQMLKNSGGGDIVIIRADGRRGGYESWIFQDEGKHGFPKVNSVSTISLSRASDANDPKAEKVIRNAEMVFFAGGDQTDYIEWLRNSKLAQAVEDVMMKKKVPVAGTSAGMALLAGVDYTGKYTSPSKEGAMVTSRDVLKDPAGKFVDLDSSVLMAPHMQNITTETHFSERNRQGRLLGLMARASQNNSQTLSVTDIKGIGADEGTAFCYDENGEGQVFGSGAVFFLRGNFPIERLTPGRPLQWDGDQKAVTAYVIPASVSGARFDIKKWTGSYGKKQFWSVGGRDTTSPTLKIIEDSVTVPRIEGSKNNSGSL